MYTPLIIINSPNTSKYTSKCEHLEHLWRTKKPTVKESRTFHSLDNEQLAVLPPPRVCLVCHVQPTAGHGRHDRFVLQLFTPRPPVLPVPVRYRYNLREYYNADIPSLYEGCCVWLLFIYLFTSHQAIFSLQYISLVCKDSQVGIDVFVPTQWQNSK